MDTCIFDGKQICAYDVVNSNLALNYELDKMWKVAGKNGKLICEDCGSEVIFKVKNPRKKVPHFAHKSSNRSCYFSRESITESENHKMGKLILYRHLKERYPDEEVEINKRFPFNRRADVFVHFKTGEKLALEYQRSELEVQEWERKRAQYEEHGITSLWFLKGDIDKLSNTEKQIEVSFFQRVMLNEDTKVALYLQVDSNMLIMGKNMRYSHPGDFSKDFDELYFREYPLEDISIMKNARIDCDFNEIFNKKYGEFLSKHDAQAFKEKKIRDIAGKGKGENVQMGFDFFNEDEPKKSQVKQEPVKEEKQKKELKEKERKYIVEDFSLLGMITSGIRGSEKAEKALIKYFIFSAGSKDMKMLNFLCECYHHMGEKRAAEFYMRIVTQSGLGNGKLKLTAENMNDMRCPLCEGKIKKFLGKNGEELACDSGACFRIKF